MTAMQLVDMSQTAGALVALPPLLDPDDLQTGDVILHEPGRQRWYEKGIARATGSPFTHASIYIGNNMIAEARLPRVRVCKVQRPMRRERRLCVLRQPEGLRPAQIDALRTFVDAALQRGARFDYTFPFVFCGSRLVRRVMPKPAQRPLNRPLPPANRTKYFCTSFVVDSYRAMGLIDRSEARAYRLGSLSAADLLADCKFGQVVGFLQTETSLAGAAQ